MKKLNKSKGMCVLLIAVAAVIGITIYGSCSADEDYDNYSSADELFTLADGEMGRGEENPHGPWIFEGVYLTQNMSYMENDEIVGDWKARYLNIGWSSGYTGNMYDSISIPYIAYLELNTNRYTYTVTCAFQNTYYDLTATCRWTYDNKLSIKYKFSCDHYIYNWSLQRYVFNTTYLDSIESQHTIAEVLSYCATTYGDSIPPSN